MIPCYNLFVCTLYIQEISMPHINLDEKSPQELRRLLDVVKTSNLDYKEKEEWIQKIQDKLGVITRDPRKERELLAQIEAGQADIDDLM